MDLWQDDMLARLSELLAGDPAVRALILTGSLATEVPPDPWCDVDLKVVLADAAVGSYYPSPAWLSGLGELIAWDAADHGATRVLRVCLAPFRRLDLSLIPRASLEALAGPPSEAILARGKVIWSREPDLGTYRLRDGADCPAMPRDSEGVLSHLEQMSTAFWFRMTIAIAKTVRNDLLVAAHLALDLARDCLVLQMMLRDRRAGTMIHRYGGWGNELVAELAWPAACGSGEAILRVVAQCGATFDRLAAQVAGEYQPRFAWVLPAIRAAIAAAPT
ncbi:MAG: aminoglycoside 6-adenylyltransferase [Candidatus Latescibacterota bacterium]|jgi:hypothetical protein